MNRSFPLPAILLALLSLVPFIGCGLGAMSEDPARAEFAFKALIAYAALVLAFLGAVHWGLALADGAATPRVQRIRYGLGIVPALIAWIALLAPIALPPWTALVVLLAGYVATPLAESRGTHLGYVPTHYMALRWALSAVMVALLACVLVVRLVGAHIRL